MKQYTVMGMTCAACQARVEKAVNKVPGVTACSVSLLTNSMGVDGDVKDSDIICAVENAGYQAAVKGNAAASIRTDSSDSSSGLHFSARMAAEEDALKDRTTPLLRKRLLASLGFLLILMYFSMGHMMWGFPLPAFFEGNHVAMGILQMLLAIIVMVINQRFFISGFKSLAHRAPNMDTLIALGSGAAFVYSTIMLFAMTDAVVHHDDAAVMSCMNEFFFESAAMILTLITVGKMLESYSKGKTTNALKSLMKLAPQTATVIRDDQEVTVSIDQVHKGDIFIVRPGENIPVDGIVLDGTSAVNEAALTGESIPVDKAPGDSVSSATANQSGFLRCEATRVGEDTSLAQIIHMVSDAAATKAPVAKLADTISGYFVPAVITLAILTTIIWLLVGEGIGFALARGISVLVVSCPCALGLATPVAIMVGNGVGARSGILFKTAQALQETGNVQIIALDKTGTITRGEPQVTDIIPAAPYTEENLLRIAAALEQHSEHPLAKAIIAYADAHPQRPASSHAPAASNSPVSGNEYKSDFSKSAEQANTVTDFKILPGNGLQARLNGCMLRGGNLSLITQYTAVPDYLKQQAGQLAGDGKTPLFFAEDNHFAGIIAVADTIRDDSTEAIRQLKNMGIHVVMLTGDNERTAAAIGRTAGVDEVISGVLPDGKEDVIRKLQAFGKTAMVGDGINDAPALTRADIGIAIGAGTDVALDAADVVLMKSRLSDVASAIRLSRQTYRNILENLFWALFYNTLLIPIAAGALSHLFGITMDPMFGAAAMSLSSFCVVSNALRLNLFHPQDTSKDKKLRHPVDTGANHMLLSKQDDASPAKSLHTGSETDDEGSYTGSEYHPEKGMNPMTKTMKIEGMMCCHCEANVKKTLEALEGVASAEVSHEAGTAIVTLSSDVADDILKNAVEAKDYKVISIA